ncbi:Ubiquitin-conjugating enzyme E2 7 [Psilocybe cubensis]|uniref:Ubiquitin-conjugating enzyme E2 7 n=1 Tax=Psilocybe cubensis TaxID=181762 RepID=A0ACB8GMY0_PSICU|nr:Ubiquitin-conjugating enzyme E2 7 [Psilocybe cubensis]KAH9476911.1 Ubiquitin-conjugating enzyme E2 7 [Psilocybe cubensis]
MAGRDSNSKTALRRLMTEYKQLTSGGSPDGMFTAGPISESDFFTWEALICGPKDTPFEGARRLPAVPVQDEIRPALIPPKQ